MYHVKFLNPRAGGQSVEHFPVYSYTELKAATQGFNSSNRIGEGSFGSVYKVLLTAATSYFPYRQTSSNFRSNFGVVMNVYI